jgi:hypothetical protein
MCFAVQWQGAWKEAIYDSSQPHMESLPPPFDK